MPPKVVVTTTTDSLRLLFLVLILDVGNPNKTFVSYMVKRSIRLLTLSCGVELCKVACAKIRSCAGRQM